jgi:hypothetical protein
VQGNKIQLTLKPVLLSSEVPPLCRFEDAHPGMLCEGVVTLVLKTGLLLTFYGDVKGRLLLKEDTGQKKYFIGQVVILLSGVQRKRFQYISMTVQCMCCCFRLLHGHDCNVSFRIFFARCLL